MFSVDKAIRILQSFDLPSGERSEAEIAHELGMPTTTVHRILRGFEQRGFLVPLPTGRYRLGPAVIRLGRRAAASLDYATLLRPVLERVAAETDELVMFAVPAADFRSARYVAAIDSPRRVRVTVEVGSSIPLTAGATAKAILAFLPEHDLDGVLAEPVTQLARGSLTSPAKIRKDLARTRERGFASSWEETYDGAWAIAAPVLESSGTPVGAIGVAIPTSRHTSEVEQAIVRVVVAAAGDASEGNETVVAPS